MFRFTTGLLRLKRVGISPYAQFLIESKGKGVLNGNAIDCAAKFTSLPKADRIGLYSRAAVQPSFIRVSRLQKYHKFVRTRFPTQFGSTAVRMRKIAQQWKAYSRKHNL